MAALCQLSYPSPSPHKLSREGLRKCPAEKAEQYLECLMKTGLKDYRAVPGNRGVQVLRRTYEDKTEFLLLSLWESYEAIRAFAGDDLERAVYYPEDKEFLLELEPKVTHYEQAITL